MPIHKLPITVSIGGDALEIEAEIDFTICAGSPATYEDPGDPAEIEIGNVEITVPCPSVLGGKITVPAPEWLEQFLAESNAVYLALGEASDWGENDGPDPDDERDRRRDDKLMGATR